MSGSCNNYFGISIPNSKQRRIFPLKGFLSGDIIAYLNINLFTASLCNKVDFLLIELAHINIISTAKQFNTNDILIYSAIVHVSAAEYCIADTSEIVYARGRFQNQKNFHLSKAKFSICKGRHIGGTEITLERMIPKSYEIIGNHRTYDCFLDADTV